jgi:D-tyrosyl-tRNA(Tyr) deacylase
VRKTALGAKYRHLSLKKKQNMRIVIQRVSHASVAVEGREVSRIQLGLLILLGIESEDSDEDIEWLCKKVSAMRIFSDAAGLMNLSVQEVGGAILVVSQFTLHGSTKKGNRPSFIRAARPEAAIPLYERFVQKLAQESGRPVCTGVFGADMKVELINDGPVTILMDSKNRE